MKHEKNISGVTSPDSNRRFLEGGKLDKNHVLTFSTFNSVFNHPIMHKIKRKKQNFPLIPAHNASS
jgi:hypothetical protein